MIGNNLNGAIPDLSNLRQLTFLDLNTNKFSGSMPSFLSNMTNLQFIDLSSNQLTGSIPPLDKLTNLKVLVLYDNNLSGPFPSSLTNLTQLQYLGLSGNNFSGSLPPNLTNMSSLQSLFLFNNKLINGSLPAKLPRSIVELQVSYTSISGSVPASYASLPNLQSLDISNTHLKGAIPVISSLETCVFDGSTICRNVYSLYPDACAPINPCPVPTSCVNSIGSAKSNFNSKCSLSTDQLLGTWAAGLQKFKRGGNKTDFGLIQSLQTSFDSIFKPMCSSKTCYTYLNTAIKGVSSRVSRGVLESEERVCIKFVNPSTPLLFSVRRPHGSDQ